MQKDRKVENRDLQAGMKKDAQKPKTESQTAQKAVTQIVHKILKAQWLACNT